MNKTSIYFILLSLLCAVGAGYLAVKGYIELTRATEIVVAAQDIPAYSRITQDMLVKEYMPRDLVKRGAVTDTKAVVGRYTKTYISANKPVFKDDLISLNDQKGANPLAVTVTSFHDPNLRAVAFPTDVMKCIGGNLKDGDIVDIVGSFKLPIQGNQRPVPVVKVITRHTKIINVLKNEGKPTGIVIAVTPQEAQEMIFAVSTGSLYMLLNPYNTDPDAALTDITTPERFINKYIQDQIQGQQPEQQKEQERKGADNINAG